VYRKPKSDHSGAFFTLQKAARRVSDSDRIIYIGTSNTAYPQPGRGLYGGSKMAAQFLAEVLAKEIGHRGIAVNSILPTAIECAGVFTHGVGEEVRDLVRNFRPIQQMGRRQYRGIPCERLEIAHLRGLDLGGLRAR
jgi:3-oxoacyl-[acyl-carrier protein] reductase